MIPFLIIFGKEPVAVIFKGKVDPLCSCKLPASTNMAEFSILKSFLVRINPPRTNIIKEVIWKPPILNWIKCNFDGASARNIASCGGIFRGKKCPFSG